VANVQRDDGSRSTLEQHLGETAGRSTDVDGLPALDRNVERIERGDELVCRADPPQALRTGESPPSSADCNSS
jgi:hypothetical protein